MRGRRCSPRAGFGVRRAFTLAETLLALSLILLLFGALYLFGNQVATSRKQLELDASRQRQVTDLFDSIERAGLMSIAGDATLGAGVRGTSSSLSMLSRSGGELVRQIWKFEEGDRRALVSRSAVKLGEESSSPGSSGEHADAEPWASNIGALRLRYLVGGEWRETFDSLASGTLPRAIEISVWFAPAGSGGARNVAAAGGSASTPRSFESAADSMGAPGGADIMQRAPDRHRIVVVDAPAGATLGAAASMSPAALEPLPTLAPPDTSGTQAGGSP